MTSPQFTSAHMGISGFAMSKAIDECIFNKLKGERGLQQNNSPADRCTNRADKHLQPFGETVILLALPPHPC